VLNELYSDLEDLENQYEIAFNEWLNIPPDPPEPREEFFNSTLQPILTQIDEKQNLIESSSAIISFNPESLKIISDTPFDGIFNGSFLGSLFADNSTVLVDGMSGIHYGKFEGDLTGSVFADDSSVIVDAINKNIEAVIVNATTIFGDLKKHGSLLTVESNTGIQVLPNGTFTIPNATNIDIDATGTIDITATGNLTLSSTSGTISIDGHISIADLQLLVANSTDFADFKSRIAALTP
jgi:hypothetical protein